MLTSDKPTPSLPPICLTKNSLSAFLYSPAFFQHIFAFHRAHKYNWIRRTSWAKMLGRWFSRRPFWILPITLFPPTSRNGMQMYANEGIGVRVSRSDRRTPTKRFWGSIRFFGKKTLLCRVPFHLPRKIEGRACFSVAPHSKPTKDKVLI